MEPMLDRANDLKNLYTQDVQYEDAQAWTQKEITDSIIDDKSSDLIEDSFKIDVKRKKLNLKAIFDEPTKRLGWVPKQDKRASSVSRTPPEYDPLIKSAYHEGILPMGFRDDDDDGSVVMPSNKGPHERIDDDTAYVPLCFTDLRPMGAQGGELRSVYFRPIITSLTEDFAPEWNKESVYGRSDQVVSYISTLRTIFMGFELHAFCPEDVEVIYKKLHWLSSLVYPEYDSEMLMKSGPVCRMRVGDVICGANKLGLPGILDSINYDYSESVWELKKDSKVPRSVKVSVGFHVIHDNTIGRTVIGDFGGIRELTKREQAEFFSYEIQKTSAEPSKFRSAGIKNLKK